MTTQPILILGVHRSGTSILSRIVQDLGVHMGYRQDSHAESTFFQRLNRRLDQECGGHWTTPSVVHECAREAAKDSASMDALRSYLQGISSLEYWGPSRMRSRAAAGPWGWKDPRTAHLLPIWNSLYPMARTIWIERHPGAAALSLMRRSTKIRSSIQSIAHRRDPMARMALAFRIYRGQPILSDALRIQSASDAVELALEYSELHRAIIPKYANEVLHLEYEALVTDQVAHTIRIAEFLGRGADQQAIGTATSRLNARSRDLYLEDPSIRAALAQQQDRVTALGFKMP